MIEDKFVVRSTSAKWPYHLRCDLREYLLGRDLQRCDLREYLLRRNLQGRDLREYLREYLLRRDLQWRDLREYLREYLLRECWQSPYHRGIFGILTTSTD